MKKTSLLLTTITFTLMGFVLSGRPTQAVGTTSLGDSTIKQFVLTESGAGLGHSLASAGDVNGDGFNDLIIGAYTANGGSDDKGEVYVVYGPISDATGVTLDSTNSIKFTGESDDDRFGSAVAGAGDVNNDGFSDIIIGTEYDDDGGGNAGAAYLILGSNSLASMTVNAGNTIKFTGDTALDAAGMSVSSAGDVNADGFDDILIGASQPSSSTTGGGAAYLIYGGTNLADMELLASNTIKFTGQSNDGVGGSVAPAGDVNNDGFADMIIGAPYPGTTTMGAAYLVYGKSSSDSIPLTDITLTATTAVKLTGEASSDYFGYSVSSAGDINGDGFDDVIIGAFNHGSNDAGAAYIVYGQATELGDMIVTDSSIVKLQGAFASDNAGMSVSSAGDFNNDGYADVLIGAPTYDVTTSIQGASYVIFGQASHLSSMILSATTGLEYTAESTSYNFSGAPFSAAGDMNNDGLDDLLIGNHANYGANGAAYLVFSTIDDSPVDDTGDDMDSEDTNSGDTPDNTETDTGNTDDTSSDDSTDNTDTGETGTDTGDTGTDITEETPDVPSEHGEIIAVKGKKQGRVKLTYSDDTTLIVDAFTGKGKAKPKLTPDKERVIAMNKTGTRLKIYDASGNKLAGIKLRKGKQTVVKVNVWNFYSTKKDNIVVVTKQNDTLKTTTLTLNASAKLKKKTTRLYESFTGTNFKLAKKKHKIQIKQKGDVVVAYKLKKSGALKSI